MHLMFRYGENVLEKSFEVIYIIDISIYSFMFLIIFLLYLKYIGQFLSKV